MLPVFTQFMMRQAVRKPIYLTSPIILRKSELQLPRMSTVHYLDQSSDVEFPTRGLHYFRGTSENKKIDVQHITELSYTEETTALKNRYVDRDINTFSRTNMTDFRNTDVLGTQNKESASIRLVNYNLLKDLWQYKGSLMRSYHEHHNLYGTYWDQVKKSIENSGEEEHQFVSITIPNMLPGWQTVNRLIEFDEKKLSRVITEKSFWSFLDFYYWMLGGEERERSSMRNITDEESEKIIVELQYKGYVCMLPLSVIRGISEDSELESSIKYSSERTMKIVINFFNVIQDKVETLMTGDDVEEDDVTIKEEEEKKEARVVNIANVTGELDDHSEDLIKLPGDKRTQILTNTRPRDDEAHRASSGLVDDDMFTDDDARMLLSHIADDKVDTGGELNEVDKMFLEAIEKDTDSGSEEDDGAGFLIEFDDKDIESIEEPPSLDNKIDEYIEQSKELKLLTSAQIRSLRKAREKRDELPSPYDKKTSLTEYSILDPELKEMDKQDIELPDSIPVVSDAFKRDVIKAFDDSYLRKTLKKDIVSSVASLERSGIIITDYEIEEVNNSVDNYEIHRMKVRPLKGRESTIMFRIPKIDEEGVMRSGNIKQKLRKVRTDLPIRKISGYKVALNSNYGKLFVSRTERKSNDGYGYITEYIQTSYMSDEGIVKKLIPEVKKLNTYELPNIYRVLAAQFNLIQLPKITFVTDYFNQDKYIDESDLKSINERGLYFVGYLSNKHIVVSDIDDNLYDFTDNMLKLDSYYDYLGISLSRLPKSFSTLKVLGKDIPLGVCLAYLVKLSGLIAYYGVEYETMPSNKRYTPDADELVLRFQDSKIVLTLDTEEKRLIFNGFSFYEKTLRELSLNMLDSKNAYLNIVEQRGQGVIHLKEIEILKDLFLDPITQDVLREMKEPTEFIPLVRRANEMLSTLDAPDINDPAYSRIRGYDRVPGLMYRALTESIRDQRIRGRANSKVELDPYKVWNYIMQDNTVKIMEETNPIVDLKEREVVTFSGRDGLQSRSTPMKMRSYHTNDAGLISEATVDSADVALNTYLTPYAKLKNTRGMIDLDDMKHVKDSAMAFSTSAELAPMSDIDDPKRINFVSIQNGHNIAANGYEQPIIRTGQEYIMPYKVGKLYANMAKESGKVLEVNAKTIVVEYKSGNKGTYPLGDHHGRMEGTVYPHELVTDLKVGDTFKQDDAISYNSSFFERAWEDPSKLVMKMSGTLTTAITLNDEVYEDSSSVSSRVSKLMSTDVIKEKVFRLDSDKHIINILPVGTKVTPRDVLFTVLEPETDYTNLTESSVRLLESIGALSPRAAYNGVIDRIEIKYNGEKSDMSPSFRKLANKLDREIAEETKGSSYYATDNRVSSEYRSEGKNLNIDTIELKVFIRITLDQSVGDKGVFGNQMKSIISEVYSKDIVSDSGDRVDAMTGYIGILDRMVNSTLTMGTTNRLVRKVGPKIADVYFGK